MRFILFILAMQLTSVVAWVHGDDVDRDITISIPFVESYETHVIDLRVTIDGISFEDYWNHVFDELFAYADVDQSGTITDNEVHLLPSARAMRFALGSGFTPPVACLSSASELVDETTDTCTRDDLGRYYRAHDVGKVHVGHGELPHSDALADAFIQALDKDKNGGLSQLELSMAESSLRKLDTNDDELISASELVPNQSYPGCAATSPLDTSDHIEPGARKRAKHGSWDIALSETICDECEFDSSNGSFVYELWSVPSSLSNQFSEFARGITEATSASLMDESAMIEIKDAKSREGRKNYSWLVPMVDRDSSGDASPDEVAKWLEIQGKIVHGQLLISVLTGGGLFEALDQNHDAGLSVRELRNAWNVLEALSGTTGTHIAYEKIPTSTLLIASRGYPTEISKSNPSNMEWFQLMDRNNDGDVSRREFTEATEHFTRLDQDHDNLISVSEASVNVP